jgi:hypothetical protein
MADEQKEKPDRRGYFRDWWAKNREAVLAKRASKYRDDPEYRIAALERARIWWVDHRNPTARVREGSMERKKRYMMPRILQAGGKQIEVFSSGMFAQAIGFSNQATFEWRSTGVLPPATMTDEKGRYWYSEAYIEMVRGVLDSMASEPWNLGEFKKRLWAAFDKTVGRGAEYREGAGSDGKR